VIEWAIMSKVEIIAELPRLTPEERLEVQAKLDELAGSEWQDGGMLDDEDRGALDAAIADYQRNPEAGSSWEDVQARIKSKLH
jgi:putative addiction module component (TIGR02574 family)